VETQAAGLGLGLELLYCVRPAPHLYSGLLAQLVREKAGKGGSRRTDVLAAGGRYDRLVRQFSESFRLATPLAREAEPPAAAVGLSVSVDKVVTALVRREGWGPALSQVVVAGHREEAARLARELWVAGVAARAEEAPRGEGLGELAREVGADMVVVCAEGGGALVSCWAEGRWLERKVAAGPAGLARWGLCLATPGPGVGCLLDRPGELGREREESKAAAGGPGSAGHGGSGPVVNYNFTFLDRDRYSKSKKRLEVTKSEKLAAALARFDSGTAVEVLALGYADTTLRAVANTLELEDDAALERSVGELCAQFPRHRKEFRAIAEEVMLHLKAPLMAFHCRCGKCGSGRSALSSCCTRWRRGTSSG
jgi:translation initiation factor 2-alpha kinase 4